MPAKSRVAIAVLLAGLASSAAAQKPLTIPPPIGVVNDFAHILDQGTIDRISRIAEDVRNKSRGEIAVVTLSDIGGREAPDVALQIGRQWKVGKIGNPGDPTRNAGAVILLVPKETNSDGRGRCFIATGSGTEGFITDATAGDICREATPAFIQKDYATGLELVTLRTAQRFATEFKFSLDTSLAPLPDLGPAPVQYPNSSGGGIPPFVYFIILFLVLSFLSNLGRRRGRGSSSGCGGCLWPLLLAQSSGRGGWSSGGGGWGGGGFGGGFGGGGGGGFGGFGGGGGFSGGGGGSSW